MNPAAAPDSVLAQGSPAASLPGVADLAQAAELALPGIADLAHAAELANVEVDLALVNRQAPLGVHITSSSDDEECVRRLRRKARPSEENEATSALTDEWPASKRARRSRPVNQALLPGELWEHVLGFLTELSPLWGVTETARDLCNASASCRALYAATQSVWRGLEKRRVEQPIISVLAPSALRHAGVHWVSGVQLVNSFLHAPWQQPVPHLERCCRKLGLSQRGGQAALINRLLGHLSLQHATPAPYQIVQKVQGELVRRTADHLHGVGATVSLLAKLGNDTCKALCAQSDAPVNMRARLREEFGSHSGLCKCLDALIPAATEVQIADAIKLSPYTGDVFCTSDNEANSNEPASAAAAGGD